MTYIGQKLATDTVGGFREVTGRGKIQRLLGKLSFAIRYAMLQRSSSRKARHITIVNAARTTKLVIANTDIPNSAFRYGCSNAVLDLLTVR